LAAAAIAAWFEFARNGTIGLKAVLVAAFTCWTASVLSLVLSGAWRHSSQAVVGILAAVLVRMSIPFGTIVLAGDGPLVQARLVGWILTFFLFTLVVETSLLVWLLRSSSRGSNLPASKVG
jgi:hypothetical protein